MYCLFSNKSFQGNNNDVRSDDGTQTQTQTQTQTSQPFSQGLTQNDTAGSPFKFPFSKKTTFAIKINGGAMSDPKPERFKSGGIKVRSGGASTNFTDVPTDHFTQNSSQPLEDSTQNDYAATQELTQASQKHHPHFTQPSPPKPLTIIQEEHESFLSILSINSKPLIIERKSTIQHNPRLFLPPEPEDRLEDETQALNDNDNIIIPATQPTNDSPTRGTEDTPQPKSSPVHENQTQDVEDNGNKLYMQSSPIVIPNTPLSASQAGISPIPTPSSFGRFTKNGHDNHGYPNNFSTPAIKRFQTTQQVAETQALDDDEPSCDSIKYTPTIGEFNSIRKKQDSGESVDTTASYYKYTEDSQTIIRKRSTKHTEKSGNEDLQSCASESISTSRETEKSASSNIFPETQAMDNHITIPETQATDNHFVPETQATYNHFTPETQSTDHRFFVPETQPLSSPIQSQRHYHQETQLLQYEPENTIQSLNDENKSLKHLNESLPEHQETNSPKHLEKSLSPLQETSPQEHISDIIGIQELDENSQRGFLEEATQRLKKPEPEPEPESTNEFRISSSGSVTSPQRSMEISEPSNSFKNKNEEMNSKQNMVLKKSSAQQTDSGMSQNPIIGSRQTRRKLINCEDSEYDNSKSLASGSSKTNSNLTRSLKRIKPNETTPDQQKASKNDTNAVPQTPPSPSVSPISRMSKSPSVTQPNDFKCRTPETDQDMDSIVALRSEFPTPVIPNSKRNPIDSIKSSWIRDKERYYPAMLMVENSSISSSELKAVFKDGFDFVIQKKDLIPLNLGIDQQIKCLNNSKVIYTIVELFDSTTEEGEKRLKELKLLKSQLPAITKSNRSKRAKSGNQSEEPNQGDKQEDLVKIVDNSGNDYAVLKEASSTGRKASNKNNQISSELVLAKISELYLTRKLGLKYIKEMQPVQESFASFDSAHIFNLYQVRAESTTTEEMPMSSIYFQNPKRKSARISEGTYYESPDEDEPSRFSVEDDLQSFSSSTRSIPSNSVPVLERLESVYSGIFSGCIFTITHTEKNQKDMKEEEKYVNNLEKKIQKQGGIVLVKGFKEILDINEKEFRISWAKRKKPSNSRKGSTDLPLMQASVYGLRGSRMLERSKSLPGRSANRQSAPSTLVDTESEEDPTLAINPGYRFAAVLANEATRTLKYMEGLALGIPCLSWQYVEDCITDQRLIENWVDYVLAAGGSSVLGGVQKSLNVSNFRNIWLQNRSLYYQFLHRKPLFNKLNTPIYLIEDLNLALQLHQRGTDSLSNNVNDVLDRSRSGSTTKSAASCTEPNKVFRSLLLMLGCESRNISVASKINDISVDEKEGAIVIFNCAEEKLGKYSQTTKREHVNALNQKKSLDGAVLFFNREWILQSIINQRIV